MSLLQASLDLLTGKTVAEIGAEQYADHRGVDRNGKSMSGARLWSLAEEARLKLAAATGIPNMVDAERQLAKILAKRARRYVARLMRENSKTRLAVIEYGPGTVSAFTGKTVPLIRAFRSGFIRQALRTKSILHTLRSSNRMRSILIDGSSSFLDNIRNANPAPGVSLETKKDDIFAGHRYLPDSEWAFIVMFGRTFGNLPAPISGLPPEEAVVDLMRRIANGAHRAWLALSIGADLDPQKAKAYYEAHPEFQLNVFYRMQVELPIKGDFDPGEFAYKAHVEHSNEFLQVAHLAVVKRDMTFWLSGKKIELKAGQELHLKNSFCFSPEFMRRCAVKAGLKPIDFITDGKGSDFHIFEKLIAPFQDKKYSHQPPLCQRRQLLRSRAATRRAGSPTLH
jgi:uncharacterized SAM-dependent methyltransferase